VLERFLVVLSQVATLFLLMGVGFALEKLGKLDKVGTGQMTTFLLYVVAPCIVIDAFQVDFTPEIARTLGVGVLALLACYGAYILLSLLFFRRTGEERRGVLRFGAIYGNIGFMGLPLVRAVMGEGAMIYAVVNLGIFNVITWTQGIVFIGGRRAFSLKKAVLNPGVLGTLIGFPMFLLGLRLPGPLFSSVNYLANVNTPVAMVIIGAQMARADLLGTFRARQLYVAAAVKLLLLPALTFALLKPLELDALFSASVVILAGAPTAGITSMFAEQYRRVPEEAAQMVTLSTLLSILTLPVVGTLVQELI